MTKRFVTEEGDFLCGVIGLAEADRDGGMYQLCGPAVEGKCDRCGGVVWLSFEQLASKRKHPELTIACTVCVAKFVEKMGMDLDEFYDNHTRKTIGHVVTEIEYDDEKRQG